MNELVPLWRRAIAGELCWLDGAAVPRAVAVTPLLDGDVPSVALPFARAADVASLRAARDVTFVVSDSRSLRAGESGVAAVGSVTVADDTDGETFAVRFLEQELAKYPPSRTLADSPLLRSENWWWLPRIIVRLGTVSRTMDVPARTNPARDALLVRERDGQLAVDVVEVSSADGEQARLRTPEGGEIRGDGGPGLVFGYDYTIPDLERWEIWTLRGALRGDELYVETRTGQPGAVLEPMRLMERVRRQRALARACKREVLAAERAG